MACVEEIIIPSDALDAGAAAAAATVHLLEQPTTSNEVSEIVGEKTPQSESQAVVHPEDVDLYVSSVDHPLIKSMHQNSEAGSYQKVGVAEQHEVILEQEEPSTATQQLDVSSEVTIVDETKTSDVFSVSAPLSAEAAAAAVPEVVESAASTEEANKIDEYAHHEEVLRLTNELKDRAKICVSARDFKGAIKLYEESLVVLNSVDLQIGSDKKRFSEIVKNRLDLTLMLLCNLSLCHFNEGNYEQSLDFGQRIAVIDPNHLKASYRRALALKKLNKIEKAFEEIKNARLIAIGQNKTDEQINKEYAVIKLMYQDEMKASKLAASQQLDLSQSLLKQQQAMKKKQSMSSSTISNISQFVERNFSRDQKRSPYFAICSAVTSFIVLKRFISIDLVTKPAIISAPILSAGFYGVLQGKNLLMRIISGSIVGIIAFVLFKITKHGIQHQLTAVPL